MDFNRFGILLAPTTLKQLLFNSIQFRKIRLPSWCYQTDKTLWILHDEHLHSQHFDCLHVHVNILDASGCCPRKSDTGGDIVTNHDN